MKQIFKKEELIGKIIKKVYIPEDSYGDVCVRFTDDSFIIFIIENTTVGFGYPSNKISIDESTYGPSSHELVEVGLVSEKEYSKAVEEQENEWKRRSEEAEQKLKKMKEEYELTLLNKLKKKYDN